MVGKKKETVVDIVKRNLWSRGYRVKDLTKMKVGFDLMVDEVQRVAVFPSLKAAVDAAPDLASTAAVVITREVGSLILYSRGENLLRLWRADAEWKKNWPEVFTKSPGEVFIRNNKTHVEGDRKGAVGTEERG